MTYFLDVFSIETYERFLASDRTIAGFDDKTRTVGAAQRVRPGDKFLGYITGLKRWAAILEVQGGPFRDETPRFADQDDPYINRFRVSARVVLALDRALPIDDDRVWDALSFTKQHTKGSTTWTGPIRNSLNRIEEVDGQLLERLLHEQASAGARTYPIDPKQLRRRTPRRGRPAPSPDPVAKPPSVRPVQRPASDEAAASLPGDRPAGEDEGVGDEGRPSIRVQASIAEIGSRMGLSIWVPPGDRGRVEQQLPVDGISLLDRLPLNYDEVTNRTIEQIDVLWLRGRSIVRAFEVEHTTAVYSGLLRMADLLALQPNTNFQLHIVAPAERREKVLQEIRRPAFNTGTFRLQKQCSYISYEKLNELYQVPLLSHLSDTVLSEYEERA